MSDDDVIPPPSDDQAPEFFKEDVSGEDSVNDLEVVDEVSEVASSQGKNVLILIALVVFSAVIIYVFIFMMGQEDKPKLTKEEEEGLEVPIDQATRITQDTEPPPIDIGITDVPESLIVEGLEEPPPASPEVSIDDSISFPEPNFEVEAPEPDIIAAPIPEPEIPPAPEPEISQLPELEEVEEDEGLPSLGILDEEKGPKKMTAEEKAAFQARRKASMEVMNAGGDEAGGSASDFSLEASSADQVYVTRVGRLDYLIAQGKVIDAVLETAINTDVPGMLRAVVVRDVYAESSKNILIPRGSRLIGTYNPEVVRRQRRIDVIWNRLLHPDGIDVAIESPGVDQLGRAGVSGTVDNKYAEMIGNSALVTAIGVMGSAGLSAFSDNQITNSNTASPDGASTATSVGTLTDLELSDGVTQFRNEMQDLADDFLQEQPTFTVDQGAKIKVFVNRDILFPPSLVGGVRIVK